MQAGAAECAFANGAAIQLDSIPALPISALEEAGRAAREQGRALVALMPFLDGDRLLLLLADSATGRLSASSFDLAGAKEFPSLTPLWPAAHLFEREIFESAGLTPVGHPWLKAVRRHSELGDAGAPPHPFLRAQGEGVHEVAVGPIHAGVIEPGHFRFQCSGEEVLHLEIQLGYQHRGAERRLVSGKPASRLAAAESIAGDTAVGHALAYCTALEALSGAKVPLRAQSIRGVALELERIANHAGDLGALCNDVGYVPGSAFFGRMRGDFLNLLTEISGNRFGRGLLVPGGVRFDVTPEQQARMLEVLETDEPQLRDTARLVFSTPSVVSRFEGAGAVERARAEELGLTGPAARACGLPRDVRSSHPVGVFQFAHVPVAAAEDGDVMARATVRWLEIVRSLRFLRDQLTQLPGGPVRKEAGAPRPSSMAIALIEGWRGAIAHIAFTDGAGQVARHRVIDPSFRNWLALALCVRGGQISDFPLCNKSFNLSYAGHDL
jgi:Ni,Fe-hydrogenase III large subunit